MFKNFYYWGPLLTLSILSENDLKIIEEVCEESKISNEPHTHNLPLKLNLEVNITGKNQQKVISLINPHVESYLNFYNSNFSNNPKNTLYNIDHHSMWINYQQKGEFRPPHVHSGHLSYVLYVDIPYELKKENETYSPLGQRRGTVNFSWARDTCTDPSSTNPIKPILGYSFFPEKGFFFIFPSYLNHFSMNFFSECVRTSISGNIYLN